MVQMDYGAVLPPSQMVFFNDIVFHQWAGPVEDLGEEFDKIDENGGGQVLFTMIIMINKILTIILVMKIV